MALNPKTAVAVRNRALDGLTTELGASPVMRWYDGTQPTDADTALGSQVAAVTLPMSGTPFPAASAGSMTANAITSAAAGTSINPMTWFSLLTAAFVRKHDGSAATSGANLNVNSTNIGSGATCGCSSLVISMAA